MAAKKKFMVSQGEHWFRNYIIEAETEEEARAAYQKIKTGANEYCEYTYTIMEPEYLDDLDDDVVWYVEKENKWDSL